MANDRAENVEEFEERVVNVNRVSKVHKGGRRFSFSALVVVGDGKGRCGAGLGKAAGVPEAIRKGVEAAKKNMVVVPMRGTTIPHDVVAVCGAARVLLKPASPGTGVIAGGPVRAIVEAAGVRDILSKSLGSDNKINCVWATMNGLRMLKRAEDVAKMRGKSVEDLPIPEYWKNQEVLVADEPAQDHTDEERD